MTQTIETTEDLLRLLDENEEFLTAVRNKILTDELIRLPAAFAEFVAAANARFGAIEGRLDKLEETVAALVLNAEATNKRLDKLEETVEALVLNAEATNKRLDSMDERLDSMEGRLDSLENTVRRLDANVGDLKGHFVSWAARENGVVIATLLDFEWQATLENHEPVLLWQTAQRQGLTEGISDGDKRSFWEVDLVIEALTQERERCYIAVEVSYTADSRDTDRAIRNAEFLTRFTGVRSFPAISSVRIDNEMADVVEEIPLQALDTSKVLWHRLPEPKSGR